MLILSKRLIEGQTALINGEFIDKLENTITRISKQAYFFQRKITFAMLEIIPSSSKVFSQTNLEIEVRHSPLL